MRKKYHDDLAHRLRNYAFTMMEEAGVTNNQAWAAQLRTMADKMNQAARILNN